MFFLTRSFVFGILILLLLTACGGGGGDAGGNPDFLDFTIRADNPNIPAEHTGTEKNNSRIYAVNLNGYKVSVLPTGLNGQVTLKLGNELLDMEANVLSTFATTFIDGTYVTVTIESQPFLQECRFAGGVNTGMVSLDATLQLQLDCVDSTSPAAPFISLIYSATVDSINLDWKDAIDRDTAANSIAYRMYWSSDRTQVENRTAPSTSIVAGVLSTQLANLQAGTLYYLALEAIDADGNVSALSDIRSMNTLETPNVLTGTPYFVLAQTDVSVLDNTWSVPDTAFSSAPQVGDVLMSEFSDSFEIVKITSLSLNAGVYDIQVVVSDITEVYETLTINNDIGFSDAVPVAGGTAFKSSPSGIEAFEKGISPSLCRSTSTELSAEQLAQITFTPINTISPRVINKLQLSNLLSLSPELTGSVEVQAEMQLGAEVGFDISGNLSGEYICELAGFPIQLPKLRYSIGPLPIIQEFALDAKIKLTLDAKVGVNGSAKAFATRTMGVKLFYNPITGQWETQDTDNFSTKAENKLDYGARAVLRAAIIPKVTTRLNYAARISLAVDAGVDGRISVIPLTKYDPIAEFRTLPFLLEDFTAAINAKLLFAADLTILGRNFVNFPEREVASTPDLIVFDTPLVCTNTGADKDICEDFKEVSRTAGTKRYGIGIYMADGINNPIDLSSIEWQVSPKNGFVEVNKNDPRNAVIEVYDEAAYTVIASAHGVLGEPARKFARFSINGGVNEHCQYGRGEDVPEEFLYQYFLGGIPAFESDIPDFNLSRGFLFPRNAGIANPLTDFHEICEFVIDRGSTSEKPVTASFYGGQRNGQYVGKGAFGAVESTIEEIYENGYLVSRKVTNYHTSTQAFQEFYDEFVILPFPGSQFDFSAKIYTKESYDGQLIEERKAIPEESIFTITRYQHPNGSKSDTSVWRLFIRDLESTTTGEVDGTKWIDEFEQQRPYTDSAYWSYRRHGVGDTERLKSYSYYENGNLRRFDDYVAGTYKDCYWVEPGSPSSRTYLPRLSPFIYTCDTQ